MSFEKRRFARVEVDFVVEIFSRAKTILGSGKAVDISASGMGVVQNIPNTPFRNGTEIFVTFTLPNGTKHEKIRAEIKGVEKFKEMGNLLKLRFSEMKVLESMKLYMDSLPPQGK